MKQSRRHGFTLLELLVVVIVVGILASVALPQFGRMIRRSRFAEAQNLVSALLTAELVYYQERATFTASISELMVDFPADNTTNFNYGGSGASNATNATVIATGRAAAAGLSVTGTITNTGVRTMTTNPVT